MHLPARKGSGRIFPISLYLHFNIAEASHPPAKVTVPPRKSYPQDALFAAQSRAFAD
jgi:hypothetical protein